MKKLLLYFLFFSSIFADFAFPSLTKDQIQYYSLNTALILAPAFGVGAIIANTETDQQILDYYQSHIANHSFTQFLSFWKLMGQEQVIIPYSILGLYSGLFRNSPSGAFTKELFTRCARAFIVGTTPLHIARALTGGSRPTRTTTGSSWTPFVRRNGVSGHTFTGAIVFITLAQMTDNPFYKSLFYISSTLTGISRINDKDHYPSQVFLGWIMAYASCRAVDQASSNFKLTATPDRISLSMAF